MHSNTYLLIFPTNKMYEGQFLAERFCSSLYGYGEEEEKRNKESLDFQKTRLIWWPVKDKFVSQIHVMFPTKWKYDWTEQYSYWTWLFC